MDHYQHLTVLVNDAIECASVLSSGYRHDILRSLEKTKNLLAASADTGSQRPLALRAAQRNLTEAERQINLRLTGDRLARFQDQVMLVEMRTLCSHALHQLNDRRGGHDQL